uniref:CHK kinase-like domain-containing protein n=1 Tax=Mucochytrium quahogii TaxID=96639 RepID=A0A7S2S9N1_9STRA|mmetsp:Transcript_2712/g.5752  ORF Transcript_2712/g.5752 Transcript_2712/m.5752 type:complete len:716 (+) Transcript_2712:26-2173(+)
MAGRLQALLRLILGRILPAALVGVIVRKILQKAFLRRAIVAAYWLLVEKITHGYLARKDGFILDATDITKSWLDKELARKYQGVRVASLQSKPMGADMGNASEMYRLTVCYDKNTPGLPTSMILKTPKNKAMSRIPFTATRMLEMETCFYNDVGCDLDKVKGIHVPKGYASRFRQEGNIYVLMEDVTQSGASFLTEKDVLTTVEELKQVAYGIASFHGQFWDSPRLEHGGDLSHIIQQTDPILDMTREFMQAGWNSCVNRMGNRMPKRLRKQGKLLIPIAQRLHDYMGGYRGGAPQTIVHGDCHLENAYFIKTDGNKVGWELGLYDFQILRRGNGAIDLASFFAGSSTPGLLDDCEDEVFQHYLDTLATFRDGRPLTFKGATGPYTVANLKRDYRLALGLMFCWNVAATLAVPFDTVAQHDYDLYMTRLCDAVDRLDIVEYALSYLGGKTVPLNSFRGDQPSWDVPPIMKVVPNVNETATTSLGIETYRSKYKTLQPGYLNKAKYLLKYYLMLKVTSSDKGHHGQKTTNLSSEFLEYQHPVDYAKGTPVEEAAFDSYYLSCFAPFDGPSPSLALRWCKRLLQAVLHVNLVGALEGLGVVGARDGLLVGSGLVGLDVGSGVRILESSAGENVGRFVGKAVGRRVGVPVGVPVGEVDGSFVGELDGSFVGDFVGDFVGSGFNETIRLVVFPGTLPLLTRAMYELPRSAFLMFLVLPL